MNVTDDTTTSLPTAGVDASQTCTRCRRTLPATREFFSRKSARPQGLRSTCKRCQALYSHEYHAEGLHKDVVSCELRISPKCKGSWWVSRKAVRATRRRNEGKVICLYCSRQLKFSGRANPNCKYPSLTDDFFSTVDTEAKAYLLGWIASDGTIGRNGSIAIAVHRRDAEVLTRLRDALCPELPIKPLRDQLMVLTVNSTRMATSVCQWLKIEPGPKSQTVAFPDLPTAELKWAFLRGYFDGDGSIVAPAFGAKAPHCSIATSSDRMRQAIRDFCGVRCTENAGGLTWSGTNALDFLARLYEGATFSLRRKRELYEDWCTWVPSLSGIGTYGRELLFRWVKTDPRAVAPFKARASDSGYDLTLFERKGAAGLLEFYRTGIKVEPDFGWYFDVVPRSSIIKTGYMLANGIGVIDRAYRGEILVPLIRVDPDAPDLELPCRIVQMIPRPIVHLRPVEVENLEESSRGEGGFGSTGGHSGHDAAEKVSEAEPDLRGEQPDINRFP